MDDNTLKELETLIPQGQEVSIACEVLTIKPLKVGQMPAFLRAIQPVLPHLTAREINWLALFAQCGDELLGAIAVAVARPRAWVDELAADEALLLAAKVIEVNADFFTRTVMPRLQEVFQQTASIAPNQAPNVTPTPASGSMPPSA